MESAVNQPKATGAPQGDFEGKLTGTRRSFIRGIAATGASTMAAVALDSAGVTSLFDEEAVAQSAPPATQTAPFANFRAIAPTTEDIFEVPEGFRADVLISFGDTFTNNRGQTLTYGYNNDFLAYFPLEGSDEGLIFVNHEYPDPFLMYGYVRGSREKTQAEIELEQSVVGNSVVHVKKNRNGRFYVVDGSRYNRRVTGDSPTIRFTGPLRGEPMVRAAAQGSVANCSGGITPWGTALSCEENYQDYGSSEGFGYGWGGVYDPNNHAKYGWVVEHDPYNPNDRPVKHTALGRFRHENTAFRHVRGKKFTLYMGDDATNEGVYKFVSDREFRRGDDRGNREILREGTLYVARWEPEGRRRFARRGENMNPISATTGTGTWVEVREEELVDTAELLRQRLGEEEWLQHFATNRPEDIEVTPTGRVFIALTNNTRPGVNDAHGSVRQLVEDGNDPEAMTFTWTDYSAGGPTGRQAPGEQGFSSPDNLVFDRRGNLWVLTDISSSALNRAPEYRYHANNAIFMVPTSGPNRGLAFRFANMPIQAEGTGPWFTPDEQTLFVNVQHPGEESSSGDSANFGDPSTLTSYWPRGARVPGGRNPQIPLPSTVVVTRDLDGSGSRTVPTGARTPA